MRSLTQVRLSCGESTQICRINSAHAKVGTKIELLDGERGPWTVVEVFDSLDEKTAEGRAHGHTKWKKKLEGKTKKARKVQKKRT